MNVQPQVAATADERAVPVIAVVGNPNVGKSTIFSALTGLRQKTANFPGVTVERRSGRMTVGEQPIELVDLPGTYSLAAQSLDEMIAVDVLIGRVNGLRAPSAVLLVLDATKLYRGLFLAQQVCELGLPVVVALNMSDLAERKGIAVDGAALGRELGVTVVPVVANHGQGIDDLRQALAGSLAAAPATLDRCLPDVSAEADDLHQALTAAGVNFSAYEAERALLDEAGFAEQRLGAIGGKAWLDDLAERRARISTDAPLAATEARRRYAVAKRITEAVEERRPVPPRLAERLGPVFNHPVFATVFFFAVMATVFQAVFAWATPTMDLIDGATAAVGSWLHQTLPAGALTSLLADGVIAGVGAVVIFLPQILILFTFIIVLEDTGYLARAAFLMDRVMRLCGLSGQSFIPMLSSFACAVPGIMATRVIPNRRDRIATIIAAPFMTCSARLPVYALLIAAFVPADRSVLSVFNLQGVLLFGLYLLGIVGGILTALLLRTTALRGPAPSFLLELPPLLMPNLRAVLVKLLDRARVFLRRAGTIIFTVAVVIWALAYFPRSDQVRTDAASAVQRAEADLSSEALQEEVLSIENRAAARQLEQSFLGRFGRAIEPVFVPLGWDWKVSSAVIAGFPAREVVVAVLGTVYAVGAEAEERELSARLEAATWPDGDPVFTLPMVIGLLIFYAFCLQCAATVAIMRRETNSWRWPVFAWSYMTGLGYVGALLAYQIGTRMGGAA